MFISLAVFLNYNTRRPFSVLFVFILKCLNIFFLFATMASVSMEENSSARTKQTYKYIAPAPPSELIDSTTFTIDFAERKFIHIGLNPTNQFNVMIHIITPSRHVSTSPEILNNIFSLMGDILAFTLETPDKIKNIIFFKDKTIKLSNMVYRAQNVLVIESLIQDGCRVLLNSKDLMTLQSMEWCIYETIVRKCNIIRPTVLQQVDQMGTYMKKRNNILKNSVTEEKLAYTVRNTVSNEEFVKNIQKNEHCYISQIKTYATVQVVEKWSSLMEENIGAYDVCGHSNWYEEPTTASIVECTSQSFDGVNNHSLLCYSPMSPLSCTTQGENYSMISPPSPPPVTEEGPSFYDLLRIPSPINISAPKRLGRAKHLHPVPTKNVKYENNY